jgi:Trk K+ transport system NAD-binding subunit
VKDYASLLQLSGEYRIAEIGIECEHWLCKKKLKNTQLREEGLNVLAISRRDGSFYGTPAGETTIEDGDTLIIYGRTRALQRLEKRLKGSRGNREHKTMMREQQKVQKKELEESQKNN